MPKHIRFKELELINFTSHRKRKVAFGDITSLSGKNGQGKTSIGIAPTWVLYGTDIYGSKFNPTPTNYEFDRVFASLLLAVDGNEIKLTREIDEKGKNIFYVNDVPTKAKEYEAAVAGLFDKDEFLSLYNPQYFFGLHWTKQREMILRHTVAPAKSEVFAEMSRTSKEQKVKDISLNPAAGKLEALTKKHSLVDLQKLHRDQKTKLEKAHIAAQSRTKTLQEQLPPVYADFNAEIEEKKQVAIRKRIEVVKESIATAESSNRKLNELNTQIRGLVADRDRAKIEFQKLNNEEIPDTCRVCRQPLQGESVKAAEEEKQKRIAEFKANYDALVSKRKALEAEANVIEWIDVSELLNELDGLNDELKASVDRSEAMATRDESLLKVEQARADETKTLADLKESIFILDAIKAYRAKEAELQAEKVQSLFTSLSIRLFKYVKTTEEWEPDFSIQMDGKDYAVLSFGEKMTAGLELTEVLYGQSELITPTFLDGLGEYTGKIAVYGQLITARAVLDQELKIETEE